MTTEETATMSVAEAAARAGVAVSAVQTAVKTGRLCAERMGRGQPLRIAEAAFLAWRVEPPPGAVTCKEAAALAGVCLATVENAIRTGKLHRTLVGGRGYIAREVVLAWSPHRPAPDEMTVPKAAELAGVPESALEAAIKRGQLACRRMNAWRYIALDALTAWVETYVTPEQREAERVAKREAEAEEGQADPLGGAAARAAAWERAEGDLCDPIGLERAAELACVSVAGIRHAIRRGDLATEWNGRVRALERADVLAWARRLLFVAVER